MKPTRVPDVSCCWPGIVSTNNLKDDESRCTIGTYASSVTGNLRPLLEMSTAMPNGGPRPLTSHAEPWRPPAFVFKEPDEVECWPDAVVILDPPVNFGSPAANGAAIMRPDDTIHTPLSPSSYLRPFFDVTSIINNGGPRAQNHSSGRLQ